MLRNVSNVFHLHLAFEGTLQLGTAKKLTANAAVGIDVVNPTNNYFYAEVTGFTIDGIVKAFQLNVELPKALKETGIDDGALVSFSGSRGGKSLCNSVLCIAINFTC